MAVLAEYRDVGPPGYAVTAGIRAYETGASIMQRKQQLRLMEQQQEQQRMEFIAKLPLIQADARLKIEQARSAIATGIQQTDLAAKAAQDAPVAQSEFFKVMQEDHVSNSEEYGTIDPEVDTPEQQAAISAKNEAIKKRATQTTLENRSTQLASLMAKYSYFKGLKDPGYSGYYDTLEKSYVATNEQLHAFIQYDSLLARAQGTADASINRAIITQQGGIDKENIKATAKGYSADTYTASRERIAAINNNTKLTLQEKGAQISAAQKGATIENLLQSAANADQAAAEASAARDEVAAQKHREVATTYRNMVQKETTYAGQAPLEVPKESPPLRAKPTAPDTSPPAEVSITIPGSDEAPSNAPLANPPEEEAAPTPAPATAREAAKVPETFHAAPIKVKDWNQAKALKKGTIYIGPDGVVYTRGK